MTAVVVPLLVLLAVALAWWSNLRAREVAVRTGRRTCRARGVQFLDDTVAFRRYGLWRDASGRRRLHRLYAFEFSAPEQERGHGWISMVGYRVTSVQLDRPDGGAELEDAVP